MTRPVMSRSAGRPDAGDQLRLAFWLGRERSVWERPTVQDIPSAVAIRVVTHGGEVGSAHLGRCRELAQVLDAVSLALVT